MINIDSLRQFEEDTRTIVVLTKAIENLDIVGHVVFYDGGAYYVIGYRPHGQNETWSLLTLVRTHQHDGRVIV